MNQHELDTIIQSGEGYKTEFKRNLNTDLSKELAAFANSSGGRIFMGIEDDGAISGVRIDNTLKSKVQMMAHDCDPSVDIELESVNNVLIIHVAEGRNKPYRCTNGFYIRNGSSSIKLSTREIIDFIQSEGKVKFDELINKEIKYPENLHQDFITRFKQLCDINSDLTNDELLTNLGLVDHGFSAPCINNAGILFFMENPVRFIAQSAVICVAYKGNTKVDIIDRKILELDIISNIDNAIVFLKRHLNLAYEIKKSQRTETLEMPEVALREAVVNAVAHRDYFEKGANVMIEVFDNRVELSNPGGLPKGLAPKDFGKRTLARNPLIAALLNRAKYIEKLGTGVQRMRMEMASAGLPEPDFEFDGFFTLKLYRFVKEEIRLIEGLNVSIAQSLRMQFIIDQLQNEGGIKVSGVAERFKTDARTIRRDLNILNKKGWILFSGTTRNREYSLSGMAIQKINEKS